MDILNITEQQPAQRSVESLPEIADAKWIWTDDDPDESEVWIYARRRFTVSDPAGALLHITADLRYRVWVNGRMVGFGPPKSHVEIPCLDTYPIDTFLHPGENIVCVLVHAMGADEFVTALMPRRGAMLACIECDNGVFIPTDSSWKAMRELGYRATGVRINDHQSFVEHFDVRSSLGKPWETDYDDSDWQPAVELSDSSIFEPWSSLHRRDIPIFNWQERPPDRLIERGISSFSAPVCDQVDQRFAQEIVDSVHLPANEGEVRVINGMFGGQDWVLCDASTMSPNMGCYAVFDFGKIWTGYPEIRLEGSPGTVVDLSYSEGLTNGRVNPAKQNSVYSDRIVLGEGEMTHRIFLPKCLRYLQIDVRRGTACIKKISLQSSTYPVQRLGSFSSSDPVLDQAWEISAHTLQLCMEDSYMDTPWRERGAWLGDVVPEAHGNYYAFGDYKLIRRFLIQQSHGQKPDGSMCGKYPASASSVIHTWNLTYAFTLLDYMRFSGDTALVAELWPTVRGIGEWLESHKTDEGLYGDFELEVTLTKNIYTVIDWAPVDTSGANTAFNAFAYRFWRDCEAIARTVGDDAEERRCGDCAERLFSRFRELFWDNDKGVFVNGRCGGRMIDRFGIHENMLAISFGLTDSEQHARILEKFGNLEALEVFKSNRAEYEGQLCVAIALNQYQWPTDKPVPVGTPYFAYWMLQGLCEQGKTDAAIEFINRHWGEFSKVGGSTVWEHWTDEGSLSHAWSCAPLVVLGKYVLGVSPSEESDRTWNIFPQRGGLTQASGRVPTPSGIIGVSWRWDSGWHIDLTVPKGIDVALGLPVEESQSMVLDGREVNDAVRVLRGHREFSAITIGSGRHTIKAN